MDCCPHAHSPVVVPEVGQKFSPDHLDQRSTVIRSLVIWVGANFSRKSTKLVEVGDGEGWIQLNRVDAA
jgi:hypothetical protein